MDLHAENRGFSRAFTDKARARAAELGVADRVEFIHGDASGHVAAQPVDLAACVGATWIGNGVAGTIELLDRSLRAGGIMLIGEPYWRQIPPDEETAQACHASGIADSSCSRTSSSSSRVPDTMSSR